MLNYKEIESLIENEQFEIAEYKTERLLKFEPDNSYLYNLLGLSSYYTEKQQKAINSFEKALELNPANTTAGLNLFEILLSENQYRQAALVATDLVAYNYTDTEVRKTIDFIDKINDETRKISNDFKQFENYFPTTFIIETALACNLKCPECAIGDGSVSRKKGFLSFEKFKTVAEKVKPFVKYFYLHLWGEPMLNKEIIKMIRYVSPFTRVNISTNGTILTKKLAEELITSGVSDIIVSIDGATQEVYEKYRVGGSLQKAFAALEYLTEFNRKYSANVNIMPQFIVFKHNQHEMQLFSNYVEQLGLKATFKAPYFRHENSAFELSDFPEFRRPEFDTLDELKRAMSDCVNPKEVFTIQINGDVILCCHDYNKATFYGNIFEQNVEEIWNSPKYRLDRWKILSGRAIDYCVENCMSYIPSKKLKPEINRLKFAGLEKVEKKKKTKVNLCSGPVLLEDWINVDISPVADITLDLEKELLPFENNSVDELVCISAINYFTLQRGFEIIKDVYRVMKDDGIVRFATQDLKILAKKYLERDEEFFFQKLPDGSERFPGITFADKFSQWFYGFESGGKSCKYVYDYETLALLFKKAGFEIVEEKKYLESEIEEIEKIDNRPEQMFFLEARKKSGTQKNKKSNKNFTEEKNWQTILQNLEKKPDDKKNVLDAAKIILQNKRYEDALKLYEKFLSLKNDEEIKQKYNETLNLERKQAEERNKNFDEDLLHRINKTLPPKEDDFHLKEAMLWLKRAFEVTNKKGVSAAYNILSSEWMVSYPETTGYIIPTFLAYSEFTGNPDYAKDAELMAEWEIALQWKNGGIGEPPGVYGLKPRVFNTAQVMLGWLAIYKKTNDEKYFNALKKAADWLSELQSENGSWELSTYMGAKSYHSRVAWALAEFYNISNEEKYSDSVIKFLDWIKPLTRKNAWFEKTSLSEPDKPWTHLYGYTIFGLLKLLDFDFVKKYSQWLEQTLLIAAENISKLVMNENKKYLGLPGVFDPDFNAEINWSCLTGNAQIEMFLRESGEKFNNKYFTNAANQLAEETKSTQYLQKNIGENIKGGIGGSFPINGFYSPFTVPNWAAKFFADMLLRKITDYKTFEYLG